MKRLGISSALIMSLSITGNAFAGERTVELAVDNMSCIVFAYEVSEAIAAVPGVNRVKIYVARRTAVVSFDDAKTTLDAVAAASAAAGYPARPTGQGEQEDGRQIPADANH